MEINLSSYGWIIGYFILFAPIRMIYSYSVLFSLVFSIIGVGGAVLIELWRIYKK